MGRVAWLAAFWLLYVLAPVHLMIFELPRIILYWEEVVLHALSVLGYGLIGSLFYAATGKGRDRSTGAKIHQGRTVS